MLAVFFFRLALFLQLKFVTLRVLLFFELTEVFFLLVELILDPFVSLILIVVDMTTVFFLSLFFEKFPILHFCTCQVLFLFEI